MHVMASETEVLRRDVARAFRDVASQIVHGAPCDEALGIDVVNSLRKLIRSDGGPRGLQKLATLTGVVGATSHPGLPLLVSMDELRTLTDAHSRRAIQEGRSPLAACEVAVVRRAWNQHIQEQASPCTLPELIIDWCLERICGTLLGPIEGLVPLADPAEQVRFVEQLKDKARSLLLGAASDIVRSLLDDPSGKSVRLPKHPKRVTAELLHQPIEQLGP
jgi:hypothetical protein